MFIRYFTFFSALFFSTIAIAANGKEGLHLDWINKNISPEENFFAYANGNWQKHHPIPPAYSSWGTFNIVQEKNQLIIKKILESAEKSNSKIGSIEQQVGDFYFSGMNEKLINQVSFHPLDPEFERIKQIKNLNDLQKTVTHLQLLGVNAIFDFSQMQDFVNSNNVIGSASQAGLSLPDKDYYLNNDVKFKKIRDDYVTHIKNIFVLLGDKSEDALRQAQIVLKIETLLAKASMSRIELRDPHAVYHIKDLQELQKITPHFSWQTFFNDLNHPEIKSINLATPNFFKTFEQLLTQTPLDEWKTYLRWHLASNFSSFLPKAFVDENFRFSSSITGTKEILPRWKRVVGTTNGLLGFAVGKLFVEKTFPLSSKFAAEKIITNIRNELKNDLAHLRWLSLTTRLAAIKKLDRMEARVGYPEKWLDYSALKIDRGPYVLNAMRAIEFLNKRELNKIGKPVDKIEWDMTPQTVNAYYDPSMNRLNIPAGILQPPFFDSKASAAVNYGAMGFVIGHEMTHGFDDQGAQFDDQGNLKNWWGKSDLQKFTAATNRIALQFSNYQVAKNTHVQGKLVMGEAVADLGGLTLAYRALHHSPEFALCHSVDGFTPDQQFFLAAAHVWALNIRSKEARHLVIIDPHPPAQFRVNGTLINMPEFLHAFNIQKKSPSSPIW